MHSCEHEVSRFAGMRTLALLNLKPGTGKTTSAVWLAHALAERGRRVLLVDADPAASALGWSELAEWHPSVEVIALPTKDLHRRLPPVAKGLGADWVVIDAPQLEDQPGIATSAARVATYVLIPVAPTPIELDRMAPIRDILDDVATLQAEPARVSVLLNRVVSSAASGEAARTALAQAGFHVLRTAVGRREVFAQSWGKPVDARLTEYAEIAREIEA